MKKSLFLFFAATFLSLSSFAQPLTGNYTIDPSQAAAGNNYQTFTAIVTDLNTNGVSGNVTVDVKDGFYSENAEFENILGAGPTSRIVFRANPSNAFPVYLQKLGTSSATGAIRLNATKYLTFDGINIRLGSTSSPRLVYAAGACSDITFNNCEFEGSTTSTTSSLYAIMYLGSSSFVGSGLTITNCNVISGSSFIYSFGSSANHSTKLTMKNCNMSGIYYAGIYASYFDDVEITDNEIYYTTSTTIQYGLRLYALSSSSGRKLDIQRNKIDMNTSSTCYALYCLYYGALANDRSLISNNFIQNRSTQGTGARYMLYLTALANVDIYNNTIVVNDGSNTSTRLSYFSSGSPSTYTAGGYNFRNNLLVNRAATNTTGSVFYANTTSASYFDNISNNLYWAENAANPYYFGSTTYQDHPSFAAGAGDLNSVTGDPQFLSNADYHLEGLLANDAGFNNTIVTDDLDGDSRPIAPSTTVDIGADEFNPPSCPRPINFAFAGGGSTTATLSWNGPNATEWELEYGPAGFTQGTGTRIYTMNNPETITGLIPKRIYDVYLRSVCSPGDTSKVAGPVLINTFEQGVYIDFEPTCGPGWQEIADTTFSLGIPYFGEAGYTLPFPILYQGAIFDEITIGLNGGIVLGTQSAQISSSISNTSPNNEGWFIFNQSLDNEFGGVYVDVVGTAPNRLLVIQYDSVPDYPGFSGSNPGTFEIIYDEATTEFYFLYEDVDFGQAAVTNGGDAEIGIRGQKQDIDVSINNVNYLSDNSCVRWFYSNCPDPKNIILGYLRSDEVAISWSAGVANESNWAIKFGPAGFDTAATAPINISTNSFIIPALQQRTDYEVYVYALCDNGFVSDGLLYSFTTPPHCANPAGISNATATDSILSDWFWSPNNLDPTYDLINFELVHGNVGFDPLTGGIVTLDDDVTGDEIEDNTLLPGGVYEVYVRAYCGGNTISDLVGPVKAIMPITNELPCDALQLPVDNISRRFNNVGTGVTADEISIVPPSTGSRTIDGWDNSDLQHTTWFKFIAPASGQIRISGADHGFDGQMALYETSDCANIAGMTLIAANDNEIDGTSLAPNFTLCTLIPGNEYYLMHDSYQAITAEYSLRMYEIDFDAGQTGAPIDICSLNEYNLFDAITNFTPGGNWSDLYQSGGLVKDSIFDARLLADQEYFFQYRFEDGCASDEVVTQINVFPKSFAGEDARMLVCTNEPFNLYQGLNGLVDHGGLWNDAQSQEKVKGDVLALTISVPGLYLYKYTVGNGVCPDDSVDVLIEVSNFCNYLGVEEGDLNDMEVYPNPTTNDFVLKSTNSNSPVQLKLYDAAGKLVQVESNILMNGTQKINIRSLEPGVYMININNGTDTSFRRIVKQ